MTDIRHKIRVMVQEAERKSQAAFRAAEAAQREAEKFQTEADAYRKTLALIEDDVVEEVPSHSRAPNAVETSNAPTKWMQIYAALYRHATPPFSYADLEIAAAHAGHKVKSTGMRTQMMNAVRSGLFRRLDAGKFEMTPEGIEAVKALSEENGPPKGGPEAGRSSHLPERNLAQSGNYD